MSTRTDFNGLIGRLRARAALSAEFALEGELVALLREAANVLEESRKVLQSVPEVIRKNRFAAQAVLTESIVTALMSAADDYDAGKMPITTAQTALRGFAAGMASALTEKAGAAPPGPAKPKLVRMN